MSHHGWHFPPDRRHVLVDNDRRASMPPDRVLAMAQVQPGETVVDLGAGNGFWVETLSRMVEPEGRVFAVDVEPVMLNDLRALIGDKGLKNVEVVQSEEVSVPLEDSIADLVVLGFVLHEPSDPEEFLQEVVRLLKPKGRVLVIDWHDRPTEHGPPIEYRISEEEARALLGAAGLSADELISPNADSYMLLAREFHPGDPEATVPTV